MLCSGQQVASRQCSADLLQAGCRGALSSRQVWVCFAGELWVLCPRCLSASDGCCAVCCRAKSPAQPRGQEHGFP